MSSGMFIIQDDGSLIPMSEQPYDSEGLLQELIARYPDLLAGNQIRSGDPRRWLLVSREQGVAAEEGGGGRWSLDHLFLDQDAVPTLVEVKRSSDTRVRREVVGQMLDYAANAIAYWRVEEIRSRFEADCQQRSEAPDLLLADLLGERVDPEEFWQTVKTNLQAGKVRLVFVADHIPPELGRVVEFLNSQMDPAEVLAVEIPQYVGGSLRSLVPRVIGITAEAQQKKRLTPGRPWDEQTFFDELARVRGQQEAQAARTIHGWALESGLRPSWGSGRQLGAFTPFIEHKNISVCPFWLLTNGTIAICFGSLQYRLPFTDEMKRRELLDRLNAIRGIELAPERATNRYPTFPYTALQDPAALKQFLEAMEWTVDQIRAL